MIPTPVLACLQFTPSITVESCAVNVKSSHSNQATRHPQVITPNAKKYGKRVSIQTWVLQSIALVGYVYTNTHPGTLGLVRFIPRSDSSKILIGQPQDESIDVGLALRKGQDVTVDVFSGSSVLSAGQPTGSSAIIDKILSPVSQTEAGTIRCIGLNVRNSACLTCKLLSLISCISISNTRQK